MSTTSSERVQHIASQVILYRADIRDILILLAGHGGAADTYAHRDSGVVGLAAGECLEHQLVALEHVEVNRSVRRAGRADLVRG